MLGDSEWKARHLDTKEKARLFAEAFFQLLNINRMYISSTTPHGPMLQLVKTISTAAKGTTLESEFSRIVTGSLDEIVWEGDHEVSVRKEEYHQSLQGQIDQSSQTLESVKAEIKKYFTNFQPGRVSTLRELLERFEWNRWSIRACQIGLQKSAVKSD